MIIRSFVQSASVLTLIALTLFFCGCDQIQEVFLAEIEAAEKEVVIGVDLALTGEYAEPYGLPMQRGFELAQEELNALSAYSGLKFRFIIEDDMSTVDGAVAAFNKLIHEHEVSIITGLAVSTQGAQAFPVAQENGVVCFSSVSSAAGLSAIGDFIFRAALTTQVQSQNGVQITQAKLGYTRAALIYDSGDAYSTSSNSEISKALTAAGVEIVATESFETNANPPAFSQQLATIMAANPDVVFISALSAQMTDIMIQGRRAVGIPASVAYIVPDLTGAEVEAVGDAADGAIAFTSWFHGADTPGNQAFVESYRSKYGIEPEPWAAQSYAALYILAEAIMTAESTDSIAVRDALANISNLDTILGQFSFNADGDAVYDPIVLIVENGELEVFE